MSVSISSYAAESGGGVFIDPHVAVGFNSAQGTHFIGGVDAGYFLDENWSVGVGAYYSAGEHPSDDREMGAGPFGAFTYPLSDFLILHAREEVNYLDLNDPVLRNGDVIGHVNETGVASVTSVGLHLSFMRHLGLSFGYRLVTALSNSRLDDGRSGTFLGFAIGI